MYEIIVPNGYEQDQNIIKIIDVPKNLYILPNSDSKLTKLTGFASRGLLARAAWYKRSPNM